MSRTDKIFFAIMIIFGIVVAFLVGIIVGGRHAAEQRRQISHICVELDNLGSDSTDPIILEACR